MAATPGLHAANLADLWLGTLKNSTSGLPITATYLKLHTGNPGTDGLQNASAETTRKQLTLGTVSGGSVAATGSPCAQWTSWAQGAETITHMSVWSTVGPSGGNYLYSFAISSKSLANGDTLNLTAHSISLTPIASTS